jgi:phospholipase C
MQLFFQNGGNLMRMRFILPAMLAMPVAVLTGVYAQNPPPGLASIENIVVIFAENRSFDVLYGSFPGANGLSQAQPGTVPQLDRDGTAL